MSLFRQGVLTAFIIATLLNLWFLLGALNGYKFNGITRALDVAGAQQFALRVEIVVVVVCAVAWWLSRRR